VAAIGNCDFNIWARAAHGNRGTGNARVLDDIEEKLADCLEQHNSKRILELCGDPIRLDYNV
jgi:hypothetical protein